MKLSEVIQQTEQPITFTKKLKLSEVMAMPQEGNNNIQSIQDISGKINIPLDFRPLQEIPKIFPAAGQVIGGMAGSIAGAEVGHPYIGSAIGGTVGRTMGEIGKIRYEKAPLKSLTKDILFAFGLPIISQSIPEAPLTFEEQKNIAKITGVAGATEAITAPLGLGLTKGLSFLGKGITKGLIGARVAERGFERGWKTLLNPEYYKNRIPKEIATKANALFNKASNVAGEKVEKLITTKYWSTSIPTKPITNEIKTLLPSKIKFSDFARSKAEEKLLTQATNDVLKETKGTNRLLVNMWKIRRNLDKMINAHSWSNEGYSYLTKLRRVLNKPIKSAGKDIEVAFDKYSFVREAEGDLGKKLLTIKGVRRETYSPHLESFVSNLLSTSKDETIRMLKDIDKIVKAPDRVIDKLLDYAASESLEKGLGFGVWQDIITGMLGGRKSIARLGAGFQSPVFQLGRRLGGRILPTTTTSLFKK